MWNFRHAVNFKNLNSPESIRCNHSFGSEFQTPVDFNRSQKAKCTFPIWSTPNKHIHSFIWAFVFVVVSHMDIRKYIFFSLHLIKWSHSKWMNNNAKWNEEGKEDCWPILLLFSLVTRPVGIRRIETTEKETLTVHSPDFWFTDKWKWNMVFTVCKTIAGFWESKMKENGEKESEIPLQWR